MLTEKGKSLSTSRRELRWKQLEKTHATRPTPLSAVFLTDRSVLAYGGCYPWTAHSILPVRARRPRGGCLVDLFTLDCSNEADCHNVLMRLLRGDLSCPRCGVREGLRKHGRRRDPLLDYQCSQCGRVFNGRAGTRVENCHLLASQLVQMARAIVDRQPSSSLARRLGLSRSTVLRWRRRLQVALAPQLQALRQCRPAG
jgi:transposase-like protein